MCCRNLCTRRNALLVKTVFAERGVGFIRAASTLYQTCARVGAQRTLAGCWEEAATILVILSALLATRLGSRICPDSGMKGILPCTRMRISRTSLAAIALQGNPGKNA